MKKLFKGKKVTIMGLGLHGGGAGIVKFFYKQGAEVLVTDLKNKEQLKESIQKLKGLPIKYTLGTHRKEDFINADLIVKNPDVSNSSPFLKIAKDHGVPIENDINLFFKLVKVPIIGVTGTKGKSTVATLIYLLLKSKYKDAILAGNIGVSPLEYLSKITRKSRVVLEFSSFALEGLKTSPNIAVITNIYPEHLNRYSNLINYINAKKIIFTRQKSKDILVLNYDNLQTRKFSSIAPSRAYFYSIRTAPNNKQGHKFACFLKGKEIFFSNEKKPLFNIENLKLYGQHNISNVLAAVSVAKIFKIPIENTQKVLKNFKGISWRQDFIKINRGVSYFNDTAATMPQSTIEAIKTFSDRFPNSKIILIAGGVDKNLDYGDLTKEITKKVGYLILLPGTASDKIIDGLRKINSSIQISLAGSMEKAVKKASETAKEKDIVLLSPGAASFNLFKNEFDRGREFNKEVNELREKEDEK